jgi:hypothetical protein
MLTEQDMEAVHVEVLARFEKEAAQARQRAELAEASAREWEARVKDKAGEKDKELAKVKIITIIIPAVD